MLLIQQPARKNRIAANSYKDMQLVFNTVEETIAAGRALGEVLQPGDVVLLDGDLGAGKTQFAKGVAAGLGIAQEIISPTFNIVLAYDSGRIPLLHFDLYRLEDASQLEDIDFYASVDESSLSTSLIEWSKLFPDEMPEHALALTFTTSVNNIRILIISCNDNRSEKLVEEWLSE